MKIKYLARSITQILSSLSEVRSSRVFLYVSLVSCCTLTSIIQAYAQSERAAIVQEYVGGGNNFRIWRNINASPIPIENDSEKRIEEYGGLSIPNDGQSWASLRFEKFEEYGGLIVKTVPRRQSNPSTTQYFFPCKFSGQWIIAWRSGDANTCDRENGGIEIITDPANLFSRSTQDIKISAGVKRGSREKQSSEENSLNNEVFDNLLITPGSEATVIQTDITSRSYTTFERQFIFNVERCESDSEYYYCHTVNSNRVNPQTRTDNKVEIEVLEGDILVKSDQNTEGIRVKKGEKYSYPNDEISDFDLEEASFSCQTIRFLNPAYLSRSIISQEVANGIADQFREHRQALGIVGTSPSNLSALEEEVIKELNLLRTEPVSYANNLERRKQFYYEKWLHLPGETINPSERIRAVDEAITFLRSQQTLPPLSVSTGMSQANQDHVEDQGSTGKNFGHTGDDRSGYWDRLRRYGRVGCDLMDENISYFDSDVTEDIQTKAQMIIFEILIEDAQRQVGRRENIFSPDFQVAGIACGSHGNFLREMCVITYAAGYLEKDEAIGYLLLGSDDL